MQHCKNTFSLSTPEMWEAALKFDCECNKIIYELRWIDFNQRLYSAFAHQLIWLYLQPLNGCDELGVAVFVFTHLVGVFNKDHLHLRGHFHLYVICN